MFFETAVGKKFNERATPFRNPLCVALDVDSDGRALQLAESLSDIVGGFKLGPRLVYRYGASFVRKVSSLAPVFIDCKFFDIPSTMEAAVRAAFEAGASTVTVHALSGSEALAGLAQLEKELSEQRPFRILAVTILTSWSPETVPSVFRPQSLGEHVVSLAEEVKKSGLSSIVCSPEELSLVGPLGLYAVTPGIRFSLESRGDQKRVLEPHEAMEKGSHVLVVGRPIIESKNPVETAMDYLTAIYEKRH